MNRQGAGCWLTVGLPALLGIFLFTPALAQVPSEAPPFPATGGPGLSNALGGWAQSLPLDPGVDRELERYGSDRRQALPEAYRRALTLHLRGRATAEAEARIRGFLEGDCTPFVHVSFGPEAAALPPELRAAGSVESQLVGALIRVESVACFSVEGLSAREALTLYTSPDFRKATESRIREIREEGDLSCVETEGVRALLAPSLACNRITHLLQGPLASEHSQVVSNGEGSRLQLIYFKESLKTFVEVPGGLAFHYVNYTRSAEMGVISRRLGGRAVRDAEERRIREFRQRLPDPGAETPPGT
jgi:hypothetical protein